MTWSEMLPPAILAVELLAIIPCTGVIGLPTDASLDRPLLFGACSLKRGLPGIVMVSYVVIHLQLNGI